MLTRNIFGSGFMKNKLSLKGNSKLKISRIFRNIHRRYGLGDVQMKKTQKILRKNFSMKRKKISRSFSTEAKYVVESPEEEERKANEDIFIPKYDIEFNKKGYALILKTSLYWEIRLAQFLILIFSGFLLYKCMTKLYDFKERKWYGLIFYTLLGFGGYKLLLRWIQFNRGFVEKMWLKKDGKTVKINSGIFYLKSVETDIKNIRKGNLEKTMKNYGGLIGFPLDFEGEERILMRKNVIEHPGVLSAILENKYIQFEEYIEINID